MIKMRMLLFGHKLNDIIVKNFNAFAYCKKDPTLGLVAEIREKEVISDDPMNDEMIIEVFGLRIFDFY